MACGRDGPELVARLKQAQPAAPCSFYQWVWNVRTQETWTPLFPKPDPGFGSGRNRLGKRLSPRSREARCLRQPERVSEFKPQVSGDQLFKL